MRLIPAKAERYIKKHDQAFVLCGAFIVFLTFVTKEGLAEHWAKRAEALNTAQYMYWLKDSESANRVLIHSLGEKIDQAAEGPKKQARASEEPALPPYSYMSWMEELDKSAEELKNANVLAERMKDGKEQSARLEKLFHITQAARFEIGYINFLKVGDLYKPNPSQPEPWIYQSETSFFVPTLDPDPAKAKQNALGKRISRDEIMLMHLNRDISDITVAILEKAKGIRESDEKWSKIAWWLAVFLYAAGWGMGLLGKICKIPVGGSE